MKLWKKKGYFDPSKLNFECRMPESTYKIIATQPSGSPRGQCGAAPSITLSLIRNGEPYLSNVTFGDDCFGGPSVYRFEISDELDGWGGMRMTVCTSPGTDHCKFMPGIPINQRKVSELAGRKN